MRLPLTYLGNPILRKKCAPVEKITEEIQQLIVDMVETMDLAQGIGLAAPQVGKSIKLFVLRRYLIEEDGSWTISPEFKVYINPRIVKESQEIDIQDEGCLSIPGLHLPVERALAIIVEATDIEGNHFREEIEGYNARVIQHENDHVNGILFIDRVKPSIRDEAEPRLKEIEILYS